MLAITILLSVFLSVVASTDLLQPKLYPIITFRHSSNTENKSHRYEQ